MLGKPQSFGTFNVNLTFHLQTTVDREWGTLH